MRLSEIANKEIIDFEKGERLGVLGQTDVMFDEQTGEIHAFIVPTTRWYQFSKKEKDVTVYWQQIKKIGQDMIIIETDSLS
ncbi:YlmC/YmxH family sporulation protein [Shouchella patagoniensis]|uniref:YlmC/YmxH family sporulation protein n=1 Tax=Shouchella patagoniensis TaxID=228576 RepID=UPI000995B3A0|nr:YlmC/YmxH family sporulation protein [Shouchella patagoniensis]